MHTIEELAESVMDDARHEEARIERERDEAVERIRAQTAALVHGREQETLAKARRVQEELSRRASAELSMRQAQDGLARKQELLNGIFDEALARLDRVPASERRRLLLRLWTRAKVSMTVHHADVARKDIAFFTRRTSVRGDERMLGGFVAHSADNKVRFDGRFETLLDEVRRSESGAIAATLFGTKETKRKVIGKRVIQKKMKIITRKGGTLREGRRR
jgi:V/A-type H+-transporting ATPase subunit E